MPYPAVHHKVTVYGDCYDGAEAWSFGWRMQTAGTDYDADAQARASILAPAVTSFWAAVSGAPNFFSTHRLQGVKVAAINEQGLYPPGHIAGEVFFANVPGSTAPDSFWRTLTQNALCVTLTSALPRGLASKGRFFLPPMSWNLGTTDGLIPVAQRDQIRTRVITLLDAVNAAEVGNANVALFSRGTGEKAFNPVTGKIEWTYPNPGRVEPVTGVGVGRVVDTIRRRRRQLVESRAGAPLA